MAHLQLTAAKAARWAIGNRSRDVLLAGGRHSSRSLSTIPIPSAAHRHRRFAASNVRASVQPAWANYQIARMSADATASDDALAEEAPPKDEMEFQAETRQLLDIVTHSLYTDKEVFLRELVSNASDALEKLRHVQSTGELSGSSEKDAPLEIRITTDEATNTLTITDTGIGMTRDEMMSNLGTIARSGSKAFLEEMKHKEDVKDNSDIDPFGNGIIGKFGVGFYSGFMVADKVDVRSKSAGSITETSDADQDSVVWESEGTGKYTIAPLSSDIRQDRGTSVVLHLKPELGQYATESTIEKILKKYSNFVGFPIFLNGNRVNTVDAIWLQEPKTVMEEKHSAFYKYVSGMYDEPLSTIHFRIDAPLDIKALFYIPSFHQEKYGGARMDPGVSMYSRKVLVEAKSPHILPEWCRFVKGVVDSEDLPLSISREKPQDTALVGKMRKALTRKIISHLSTMMRKDTDRYKDEFYKEYGFFLKEGICQDYDSQKLLSKLLYFETNKGLAGEMVSLDEYVSRCPPEQKDIYYLFAPSRELALQSPYMEGFSKSNREVIFIHSAIDDFVMANLKTFEGRNLLSIEMSEAELPDAEGDDADKDGKDEKDGKSSSGNLLSSTEATEFCAWFQTTLSSKVSKCKTTKRLSSSPAVVTDNESGAMRRMMRNLETQDGMATGEMPLPKQTVEINPNHEIIHGIHRLKETDPVLAQVLAEQVLDNCLVAAGLLDDGRSMLPRLNDLMLCIVKSSVDTTASEGGQVEEQKEDVEQKDSEESNDENNEGKDK